MEEMRTKIVGVTHDDRQANVAALQAGQKLWWMHEYDNPFDPNAIKIFADQMMKKPLGYLSRELAKDIVTQKTKFGYEYEMCVAQVTGGFGKTNGVNIIIRIKR